MSPRVFITGDCGYIGTALRAEYRRLGVQFGGCDIDAAYDPARPTANFAYQDLTPDDLDGYDTVVHLAGISSVASADSDPDEALRQNCDSIPEFADIARQAGVRHFVFASSGAVYGRTPLPAVELRAANPMSVYATTKARAEQFLQRQAGQEFRVSVLRIGSVNGDHGQGRIPMRNVLNAMVADCFHECTIRARPDTARNVVHVCDVARCIAATSDCRNDTPHFSVSNVGGDNLELAPLACHVRRMMRRPDARVTSICDDADTSSWMLESGMAERRFGWKKSIGIDEMIRGVHAHLVEHKGGFA